MITVTTYYTYKLRNLTIEVGSLHYSTADDDRWTVLNAQSMPSNPPFSCLPSLPSPSASDAIVAEEVVLIGWISIMAFESNLVK
jgi:hypothetical protein